MQELIWRLAPLLILLAITSVWLILVIWEPWKKKKPLVQEYSELMDELDELSVILKRMSVSSGMAAASIDLLLVHEPEIDAAIEWARSHPVKNMGHVQILEACKKSAPYLDTWEWRIDQNGCALYLRHDGNGSLAYAIPLDFGPPIFDDDLDKALYELAR